MKQETNINDMELTRQKWVNEGGILYPISGSTVLLKTPGKGIFNLVKSPNPMDARLGLQRIGDTFEFNFKIYELGCDEMLSTIKKTWESDVFVKGEKMKETKASSISEWLHKPQKDDKDNTNEDLLEDKYNSVYLSTVKSNKPSLIRETVTSHGTIETAPNADGYFLMRSRYDENIHLCLLLRKKNSPSLYRGQL